MTEIEVKTVKMHLTLMFLAGYFFGLVSGGLIYAIVREFSG